MKTPEQMTLRDLALYFLKLGTIGFGGPAALVGYMARPTKRAAAMAVARRDRPAKQRSPAAAPRC
ncbi:MAG TPA: hypothetical protein VGR87_09870 [Candidatus Limnocylindria bacterium]|nr:hypothetical protein [Candidatus Limnocylindria bacterium]